MEKATISLVEREREKREMRMVEKKRASTMHVEPGPARHCRFDLFFVHALYSPSISHSVLLFFFLQQHTHAPLGCMDGQNVSERKTRGGEKKKEKKNTTQPDKLPMHELDVPGYLQFMDAQVTMSCTVNAVMVGLLGGAEKLAAAERESEDTAQRNVVLCVFDGILPHAEGDADRSRQR